MSFSNMFLRPLLYCITCYYIVRSIYRLFFHRLWHIPGPKLAAISTKWLAYHDLVHFGKLVFAIEKLHQSYGPVVRVGPNELHIFDIESYHVVFKSNRFDVDTYIHQSVIFKGSLLGVSRVQDAKLRRDVYRPFFSKQAIRKLEPVIQNITDTFFRTLDRNIKAGRPVNLTLGFKCYALEVVTRYCFAEQSNAVSLDDFHHPVVDAFLKSPKAHRPKQHFLWVWSVVEHIQRLLPVAILRRLDPDVAEAMVFLRNQNTHIARRKNKQQRAQDNLFDAVLDSVARSAKGTKAPCISIKQLQSEAGFFIAAGTDTTSHTLEVGIWGLITNPRSMARLVDELRTAIPSVHANINCETVEQLPYLTAVIKESLRFAHGIPGRLLRIVPHGGLLVAGRSIPAGTTIGHSHYLYHMDEDVFRNARDFVPERWLVQGASELEKHLLSFSRGNRACLGINLAYTELYLMFARLLRKYEVKNSGTTAKDMEWRDFFVPFLNGSLRVSLAERIS